MSGVIRPPKELMHAIGGAEDFDRVGQKFLRYFTEFLALRPDERVLDVGCGVGRIALPLTTYMEPAGSYEGFDVSEDAVNWCTEQITPRFPHFRFQRVDIFNKHYNPEGSLLASNFEFPYEDDEFDLIFATSVFTHMLPSDVEHYFSEIARVLKNGGRLLLTFFLLNPESLELLGKGKSLVPFDHDVEEYRVSDKRVPEAVVAYPEGYVWDLYKRFGFRIREPVHYGNWPGRTSSLPEQFQDLVLADY